MPSKSTGGIPGDCFREPVGRDLMDKAGEKKLGGAAMKRTRQGVLIQGSLEMGDLPVPDHQKLERKFLQRMATSLGEQITPKEWPGELAFQRMDFVNSYSSPSGPEIEKVPDRCPYRTKVRTFSTCLV